MLSEQRESFAAKLVKSIAGRTGAGGGSTGWYGLGLDDGEGHDRFVQGSSAHYGHGVSESYTRGRHIEDRLARDEAAARDGVALSLPRQARQDATQASDARRDGDQRAAVERGPQASQAVPEGGRVTRQVLIQGQGTLGQTLYICIGIPGSGKSTWAKEQTRNCDDIIRVNKDDLRAMLYERPWNPELEDLTNQMEITIMHRGITRGYDIINDSTNLTPKRITQLVQVLGRNKCTVELVWFDTPFSTCYLRNTRRDGRTRVPEERMLTFKSRYSDMLRKYRP